MAEAQAANTGVCGPPIPAAHLRSIHGKAKVTFGNFELARRYYVRFREIGDDNFILALYKDEQLATPYQEEWISSTDVCGLDWGTYERKREFLNWLYLPPKYYTFITLVCKTKSITLLFSKDTIGVHLSYWRTELQAMFRGNRSSLRERLRCGEDIVTLQVWKKNISIVDERSKTEPARVRPGMCWVKEDFYNSEILSNDTIELLMKQETAPNGMVMVCLKCERSGFLYGQYMTEEDIIRHIQGVIFDAVVVYEFTGQKIYEDLQDVIDYDDKDNDFFDLNKLEDPEETEHQMKNTMCNVRQKVKNNVYQSDAYTTIEKRTIRIGHLLRKIRNHFPEPDTLKLPEPIRCDICVDLYKENPGESGDWTELASKIGIKYSAVRAINAFYHEENPNMYKTEFILRHWQYTYNQYWDKAEAEYPDRPKLPCTIGGLRKALKSINQHKILRKLSEIPDEENEPLEDVTTTPTEIIYQRCGEPLEDLTTTPKEIIYQRCSEPLEDLTTTPQEIIQQKSCEILEDLTTTPKEIIEQSCEPLVDPTTTPKQEITEQRSCELQSYDNLAYSAEDCDSLGEPWQILLESSVTNTEVFV